MPTTYVIWSFEHAAWWRPGGYGYTPHLEEAGRFTGDQAAAIVAQANLYQPEEHERLLLEEDAQRLGARALGELSGRDTMENNEMIEVTSMSRPDPSWRVRDITGHEHRWYADGQPAGDYSPMKRYTTPTLRAITEKASWPDGEEYDAIVGYECVQCGARLDRPDWPRRCADTERQFIPPGLR
jgi:hypothetical protein